MKKFRPPFIVKVLKPYTYLGRHDRFEGELLDYCIRENAEAEHRLAPAGHTQLLTLQPNGEYA